MNKKNLIILAVLLAVVLAVGFFIYRYSTAVKTEGSNSANEQNQPKTENPPDNSGNQGNPLQVELEQGGIKAEGTDGGGSLSVCSDKCGDGVCQQPDPTCDINNSMNCTCPETPQDCPQDCK